MPRSGWISVVVGFFVCFVAVAPVSAVERGPETEARVITDGHLRAGHLETMRVRGLPGKGVLQVSFFPTAICEDECGARSFLVGRSNANGMVKFRVRVPGTFFDHRGRHTYFRDGERINVNLTWEGSEHSFVTGSASPEPVLVRTHGARDD
jgi:hypothetical protein